ncbi:MAG: hypothetical protein AAF710_06260 [Planctomycetota bacterium]
MLFQATLIAVIAYLTLCYLYGLYLLWKLFASRRSQASIQQRPASGGLPAVIGPDAAAARPASPAYEPPAKAA